MYLTGNRISRKANNIAPAHLKRSLMAVAIALLSTSTYAQQSVIEEVTVTAQKREQNMQDVSVAVSALTGFLLSLLYVATRFNL